jgi:hypothetical protein
MSLLDWIKGTEATTDPELGTFVRDGTIWTGKARFHDRFGPFAVRLTGDRQSPHAPSLEALRTLHNRFESLFDGVIADDLYEMELNNTSADHASAPPNRAQIYSVYLLDRIEFASREEGVLIDFCFTHRESAEHRIRYQLVDFQPVGIAIED